MKALPRWYFALIASFLLGIHRGFIALWTADSPDPAVIFPYSAVSLPERDRKALEQGIPLAGREELAQILEDFLS